MFGLGMTDLTTLETPWANYRDNMVLMKSGDVWAYYKVNARSISNHDVIGKEKQKNDLAYVLRELRQYGEIDLALIPRDMNLRDRFFGPTSLARDFAKDLGSVPEYYANKTISSLEKEFGTITQPYYWIGVRLKNAKIDDSLKESILSVADSVSQKVAPWLGFTIDVDDSFFDDYVELNAEVEKTISVINGGALSETELVYALRNNWIRGTIHKVSDESTPDTVENITDGVLQLAKMGILKVSSLSGESFVAFLPVSKLPANLKNKHLFEYVGNVKFPVEFHVKLHHIPNNGMLGGLRTRVKSIGDNIKNEQHDRRKAGNDDADERTKTAWQLLPEMKKGVEKDIPYFNWLGVYVISARSIETLQNRIKKFKTMLARKNIELSLARGQQIDLFYRLLQGNPISDTSRWVQTASNDGVAENLFGVTQQVGNNTGFVIGRVSKLNKSRNVEKSIASSRDIVLFNPLVSNQGVNGSVTSSPHFPITGQTGQGKSFLVKLILMNLSMLNTKVLYIDPKMEVRRWFSRARDKPGFKKKYPELISLLDSFHFTTLNVNERSNWGILDPITFLAGTERNSVGADATTDPAFDVAMAMFDQVYTIRDEMVKTAIRRALVDVIKRKWDGERVGMLQVVDSLRNNEEKVIHDAGEALQSIVSTGLLRLGFFDGSNDSVSFDSRVNILEVSGLDLPDQSQSADTYTTVQRNSLALMFALGKFADRFGRENPDEYTFEIIDEAWIFNVSATGKALMKSIKRVGRSFNNSLVYATQSIDDISSEEDHGQYGVIFAFDEPSERDKILNMVQLDNSESNRTWLSNFVKGEVLMRDIYGRVNKVAIDAMFPEFVELFKTLNENESAKAEELFG